MTVLELLAEWEKVFDDGGAVALIERCKLGPDQLSEFLVYRSSGGGTQWPTELVRLGADPNFCDDEGGTVLSQCVHATVQVIYTGAKCPETFETAVELLSLGADPNQICMSSYSVTSLALSVNRPEFVALFMLAGADLDRIEPDDGVSLREILRSSERIWARQLLTLFPK